MCLKIDKTLIGMGFTTGDVPTARVSALMRLKTQHFPQMSVRTNSHTHGKKTTTKNKELIKLTLDGSGVNVTDLRDLDPSVFSPSESERSPISTRYD